MSELPAASTPVVGAGSGDPKRTDPFQFGNRLLNANDDVFKYNAWDHVEVDDEFKSYAEAQYDMQRQSPVSDFDKGKSFGSLLFDNTKRT